MKRENLAKRLKELRALRGMSQEYLAEEARVSLRTIQRIENNESEPTGETIKRIANALDVQLIELTGNTLPAETNDLNATFIYLKKQLSKTTKTSEIKTFEKFIGLLERLKSKDLTTAQKQQIDEYIQYLELEKIPSFSNEIYKQKLTKFKKHLRNNLGFVPEHLYTTRIASFAIAFAIGFSVQKNINTNIKIIIISIALLLIVFAMLLDSRLKKQNRSLNF